MKKIQVGKNRIQKFDSELRNRLFDFNINDYETVWFLKYNLYKNFNFSIFTDSYCNADCKFCCAKLRYEQECKNFCRSKDFNEEYFKKLDKVLGIIREFNPSISITGGEPTISPKIFRILELVEKYNFRKKVITTNGSGIFRSENGKQFLKGLLKLGLTI